MAEIGRWNGHIFEVSASIVRWFSALTIKAGCETEDKTSDKQKYVKRKAGNAAQVTMTITLLSALGCDVRREMETFLEEARAGKKDYFYIGNSKLLPEKLMLTDANTMYYPTRMTIAANTSRSPSATCHWSPDLSLYSSPATWQ